MTPAIPGTLPAHGRGARVGLARLAVPAGLVLVAAGVFLVYPGLTYTSRRSVVDLGDFHASVEEQHRVPGWIGGAVIAGGILLLAAGRRRPSNRAD